MRARMFESSANEGMMALRRTWVIFLSVFALLLVYSVAATLLLDRKGYSGDDWAFISIPFWYPIPEAFTQFAVTLRRPAGGFWYGIVPKLLQYNDQAMFLAASFLHICNSILLGLALW
ncbi:MAG: hypothetical protein ACOYL5_20700, partial [Phototrophicaceae bacterium]